MSTHSTSGLGDVREKGLTVPHIVSPLSIKNILLFPMLNLCVPARLSVAFFNIKFYLQKSWTINTNVPCHLPEISRIVLARLPMEAYYVAWVWPICVPTRGYFACRLPLGQNCKIKDISTLSLQNYKRNLQKHYGSVGRLNLHISIMKAIFHWARKNDILKNIPNIDAVSRAKVIHQDRFTFDSTQIHRLLVFSDTKMKAMIWFGLNCGFGCTDCAYLKWTDLDLVNGRVKLPRRKTGICRDLPLWLETVKALQKIPRTGNLVFYNSRGNPYMQTILKTDDKGNEKYTMLNNKVLKAD
jgi:integrase